MQGLRFTLSGPWACFRKPDVNAKAYFTYNNIHKVALLGLLGAILGLAGYGHGRVGDEDTSNYPEFYRVLAPLLLAVQPQGKNGYFSKKIQYFNNSVGYASKEVGGNLQVREQCLENPSWKVWLLQHELDNAVWEQLNTYLLQQQCVYIPYLGRNDFPAEINEVKRLDLEPSHSTRIDSLFLYDEPKDLLALRGDNPAQFLFVETAPTALVSEHNFYQFGRFVYTNCLVPEESVPPRLYTDGKCHYSFY